MILQIVPNLSSRMIDQDGVYARLILSQFGTGSIVCINVLNEVAMPLRFPSLLFSSLPFDQGELKVFPLAIASAWLT
jgi:hypothetical protein